MRIELDKLEEHGGKFTQLYEANDLPLDDAEVRLIGPAKVSGRLRRDGNDVALRGSLQTKLEVVCGRCLQLVLLAEDLNVSVFDGEGIELDDLVREELLLAVPVNVLCREDCKGLCPICGIDRNLNSCQCEVDEVDSRWQKLKELQM